MFAPLLAQGLSSVKSEAEADHHQQQFLEFSGDDHHCLDHDSGFSDFYVCPNMD